MRISATFALFSIASLASASGASAQVPTPAVHFKNLPPVAQKVVSDADIDKNIDPDIIGTDRSTIAAVMKNLKPENRVNALYFASDGKIYGNHRALIAKAEKWASVGTNVYQDAAGHRFPGPPELARPTNFTPGSPTAYDPPFMVAYEPMRRSDAIAQVTPSGGGTTGPYRRVYAVPNYSYFNGYISIPCAASNIPGGAGAEAGYVYSGGWSPSGNSVDAGFQYSSFYDNYALFVKEQGIPQLDASGSRFDCGQDVYLQFYPSSAGNVTAAASGYGSNVYQQLSVTQAVTSDWTPVGTNVVLKRMTTIAQTAQQFNDGTYFGYDPVANAPLVHWYSSRLGRWDQGSNTWPDQPWTGSYTGGYQSWPSGDSTRIIINYVTAGEETDGINLHQ